MSHEETDTIENPKGKGWINKTFIKGSDNRIKEVKLTKIGNMFAKRLFR